MSQDVERVYTINLGKVLLSQSQHRAVRAVNMVREFARHHMKTESIKIEEELAHKLWERGVRSPPRKIRVRMSRTDEGHVLVSLYDEEAEPAARVEPEKEPATVPAGAEPETAGPPADAPEAPAADPEPGAPEADPGTGAPADAPEPAADAPEKPADEKPADAAAEPAADPGTDDPAKPADAAAEPAADPGKDSAENTDAPKDEGKPGSQEKPKAD